MRKIFLFFFFFLIFTFSVSAVSWDLHNSDTSACSTNLDEGSEYTSFNCTRFLIDTIPLSDDGVQDVVNHVTLIYNLSYSYFSSVQYASIYLSANDKVFRINKTEVYLCQDTDCTLYARNLSNVIGIDCTSGSANIFTNLTILTTSKRVFNKVKVLLYPVIQSSCAVHNTFDTRGFNLTFTDITYTHNNSLPSCTKGAFNIKCFDKPFYYQPEFNCTDIDGDTIYYSNNEVFTQEQAYNYISKDLDNFMDFDNILYTNMTKVNNMFEATLYKSYVMPYEMNRFKKVIAIKQDDNTLSDASKSIYFTMPKIALTNMTSRFMLGFFQPVYLNITLYDALGYDLGYLNFNMTSNGNLTIGFNQTTYLNKQFGFYNMLDYKDVNVHFDYRHTGYFDINVTLLNADLSTNASLEITNLYSPYSIGSWRYYTYNQGTSNRIQWFLDNINVYYFNYIINPVWTTSISPVYIDYPKTYSFKTLVKDAVHDDYLTYNYDILFSGTCTNNQSINTNASITPVTSGLKNYFTSVGPDIYYVVFFVFFFLFLLTGIVKLGLLNSLILNGLGFTILAWFTTDNYIVILTAFATFILGFAYAITEQL